MMISISHHCANLAPGWALMPTSTRANFPTTTFPTTTPTTTPTTCVKTSRARHKQRQASKLHHGVIPGASSPTPKSSVSGAEKFGFECPKVWFRVLKSLVPGLGRSWGRRHPAAKRRAGRLRSWQIVPLPRLDSGWHTSQPVVHFHRPASTASRRLIPPFAHRSPPGECP
jgi:hypothetical protein